VNINEKTEPQVKFELPEEYFLKRNKVIVRIKLPNEMGMEEKEMKK